MMKRILFFLRIREREREREREGESGVVARGRKGKKSKPLNMVFG